MRIKLYSIVRYRIKKKGKEFKLRFNNLIRQGFNSSVNQVHELVKIRAANKIYYFLHDLMKNDQYNLKV